MAYSMLSMTLIYILFFFFFRLSSGREIGSFGALGTESDTVWPFSRVAYIARTWERSLSLRPSFLLVLAYILSLLSFERVFPSNNTNSALDNMYVHNFTHMYFKLILLTLLFILCVWLGCLKFSADCKVIEFHGWWWRFSWAQSAIWSHNSDKVWCFNRERYS